MSTQPAEIPTTSEAIHFQEIREILLTNLCAYRSEYKRDRSKPKDAEVERAVGNIAVFLSRFLPLRGMDAIEQREFLAQPQIAEMLHFYLVIALDPAGDSATSLDWFLTEINCLIACREEEEREVEGLLAEFRELLSQCAR